MESIIYILILIFAGAYIAKESLYHLHMFQLNSYRSERYFRFLKNNRQKFMSWGTLVFYTLILLLSSLYTFVIEFQTVWLPIIWMVLVLLRVIPMFLKKEKVKKPLVITMRVRRMIGLLLGLNVLLVWIASQSPRAIFVLTLLMIMAPIVLLLANLMLKPVESYLKKRYYNEAKKILTDHKDLIKVGITGSYGKTSTKFILETILSQQFTTLVTPHSYNTTLGVVITVRKSLNRSTEVFVAEMGAKQKGDIKEICDLVMPDYGIITAVGPQHLETFGSLSNVIDTKFELMEALDSKGKGIVNGDSRNVREGMSRIHTINYMTYGSNDNNTIRIENVKSTIHGSSFTLVSQGGKQEYETKLLGMHNILNIAGAIGLAMELGMSMDLISRGVKEIKPIPHRLELKRQGDYYLLDDAFNSNPTGAKFALDVLGQFDSGQKMIMTPGMIELGNMDEEIHFEFGKQIAAVCDRVILVGENKTKHIYRGLVGAGYDMEKVLVVKSVYEGFAVIGQVVEKGDVILIENDLPDNFNE